MIFLVPLQWETLKLDRHYWSISHAIPMILEGWFYKVQVVPSHRFLLTFLCLQPWMTWERHHWLGWCPAHLQKRWCGTGKRWSTIGQKTSLTWIGLHLQLSPSWGTGFHAHQHLSFSCWAGFSHVLLHIQSKRHAISKEAEVCAWLKLALVSPSLN